MLLRHDITMPMKLSRAAPSRPAPAFADTLSSSAISLSQSAAAAAHGSILNIENMTFHDALRTMMPDAMNSAAVSSRCFFQEMPDMTNKK